MLEAAILADDATLPRFQGGPTKATTTSKYGKLPEAHLAQRVAMIEAMEYPELDLPQ